MNTNYDILFEESKKKFANRKLLLHICCAPCATQCLTRLLDCFDITLFYSNDNITDSVEWLKRLDEVQKLLKIVNDGDFETQPKFPLKLVVPQYDSRRFFDAARGLEAEREGGARCAQCFALRLGDTFSYAQNQHFDLFGTTLTVSPYKNSQLLNEIGIKLASSAEHAFDNTEHNKTSPIWLPNDFKKRNGYNESIRLCAKYGIYRQHYCGCVFSKQTNC